MYQDIKIKDIQANDWNTNKMDADQFARLKQRIKKLGLKSPIEVIKHPELLGTEKYVVVDGWHRLKACKELGFETVSCIVDEPELFKTKEEIELQTLAKNRIHGEDDREKLKERLTYLTDEGGFELWQVAEETGLNLDSITFLVSEDFDSFVSNEEQVKEKRQQSTLSLLKVLLPTDLAGVKIDEEAKQFVIKCLRKYYNLSQD